ncbi:MAG: NlpC/P60 family protein, partial [Ruminiclostridium sp.]|nr:NlpC/P60 family protein [Ruminiclostridium sp.]
SYLLNGLSSMGMDSSGMIYICSKINGLNLPRDLQGQMNYGEEIQLDSIAAGDIVFLGESENKSNISDQGIYLGNGQYIHASRTLGYVRLEGLNESGSDGKPVFARRIFR